MSYLKTPISNKNIAGYINPGYLSGIYYLCNFEGITNTKSTCTMLADGVYFGLWYVSEEVSIQHFSFDVTTLGGNLRLGIYNFYQSPTNLVADLGIIDVSTIGTKTVAASLTLQPGFYAFGFLNDSTTIYQTSSSSTSTIPSAFMGEGAYSSLGATSMWHDTVSHPYVSGLPADVTADFAAHSYSHAAMAPILTFQVA